MRTILEVNLKKPVLNPGNLTLGKTSQNLPLFGQYKYTFNSCSLLHKYRCYVPTILYTYNTHFLVDGRRVRHLFQFPKKLERKRKSLGSAAVELHGRLITLALSPPFECPDVILNHVSSPRKHCVKISIRV